MPGTTYFGDTRIGAFSQLLADNGVPVNGVSITANAPAGVAIDFKAEATAEQIAWATDQRDNVFDWRRRRALPLDTVQASFFALTAQQKATFQSYAAAVLALDKPELASKVFTAAGISLPVDEVDPTEVVP